MDLEEFYDYKNRLMKDLCSNERIVRLVTGDENAAVPNHALAYSQLYPYQFVPETVTEATTFICFDMDLTSGPSKTFYMPILYIWPFTHKSKLRLPQGGLLIDSICSEICRMLNGSRFYGLGTLQLTSTKMFVPILDYLGRSMVFTAVDFNNLTASSKTPSNRKRGL